jgi:hypothetical protein
MKNFGGVALSGEEWVWNKAARGRLQWNEAVDVALDNFHRLGLGFRGRFSADELFLKSRNVYEVKRDMSHIFEIFPWFLPSDDTFRETLLPQNGEDIDQVTQATNFFRCHSFRESDEDKLKTYYLQTGPPHRPLWSIVELRAFFGRDELHDLTSSETHICSSSPFHSFFLPYPLPRYLSVYLADLLSPTEVLLELRDLSARLSALEEKVCKLVSSHPDEKEVEDSQSAPKKRRTEWIDSSRGDSESQKVRVLTGRVKELLIADSEEEFDTQDLAR